MPHPTAVASRLDGVWSLQQEFHNCEGAEELRGESSFNECRLNTLKIDTMGEMVEIEALSQNDVSTTKVMTFDRAVCDKMHQPVIVARHERP